MLHAEAVDLVALADAVGTPFYCYSTATLERHYRVFAYAFADVDALVCYAMKANSNQSVLRTLARLGAGSDVVSGGELKRALAAGFPPHKILFSGVGKTEAELRQALGEDILCINVESEPELELLSRLAAETGRIARVSVRINPDVDFGSHAKSRPASPRTSSAFRWFRRAPSMPAQQNCRGSRSPASMSTSAARSPISLRWKPRSASSPIWCKRCAPTATPSRMWISAAGSAFPIISTGPRRRRPRPMPKWSSASPTISAHADVRAGPMIVGNAGILVTRVIYLKHGDAKNFS